MDDVPMEPPTDEEMDQWEAEALAIWDQAMDERAHDAAEAARLELLDLQRAMLVSTTVEPY